MPVLARIAAATYNGVWPRLSWALTSAWFASSNPGTVGTFLSKAEKDPDAARDHSEKLKTRDYYIGDTFCSLVACETGPN